jgi:dethiobiotin synthetase
MKQTFFITGTDTGVGKTVLTALLAAFLRERGARVAALKPVCSGGRADAVALHAALAGALPLDEINPWHFRAPMAPLLAAQLEKKSMKLAEVASHIRATGKNFDAVLVEGAGGLLSPLGEDVNSRNLISALRATPIVVAQNKLGAVNHILLTLEALPKNRRSRARVVLMSPPTLDAATQSNEKLLAQFVSPGKIFTMPWLGQKIDSASALENPAIRRMLRLLAQV